MLIPFLALTSAATAQELLATLAKSPQVQNLVKMVQEKTHASAPASNPPSQNVAPSSDVAPAQAPPATPATSPADQEAASASPPSQDQPTASPDVSPKSVPDTTTPPATDSSTTGPSNPPTGKSSSESGSSGSTGNATTIVLPICGAAALLVGAIFFVRRHNKNKKGSQMFDSDRAMSEDSSSGHASIYSDLKHMEKHNVTNSLNRATVQTASTMDSRGHTEYSDYVGSQYKGADYNSQYASEYASDYNADYVNESTDYSQMNNRKPSLPEMQRMSHLSVSNIVKSDADADTVAGTQYNSQFQSYYTSDSRISGISEYSEYSELSVYTEDTGSSHQPDQRYSVYSESELGTESSIQYK